MTLAIVREVAAVLETDPTMVDDAHASPIVPEPGILYLWPSLDRFYEEGDGSLDRHEFTFEGVWVIDAQHERAAGIRDEATTELIDERIQALATVVRDERTGSTFEHLRLEQVDHEPDEAEGHDVRGFGFTLTGYMLEA